VSEKPKIGPETPQRRTAAMASRNVDERPTCRSVHRAKRAKRSLSEPRLDRSPAATRAIDLQFLGCD
jgi:hypothetical protein